MTTRLALLALGAGALLLFVASIPSLLEVSDPLPERADAIFVFAGEVPERARCAAELYHRRLAPVVVFSGANVRPELAAIGRPVSDGAVGALIAADAGVPPSAETVIEEGTSTWEDAGVLRRWTQRAGARTVVAVTSPLHSRRARRALRLAFVPAGADVRVVACGSRYPFWSGWWLEERPLVAVTNEVLKLALYGARYFAPAALGLRPRPGDDDDGSAAGAARPESQPSQPLRSVPAPGDLRQHLP